MILRKLLINKGKIWERADRMRICTTKATEAIFNNLPSSAKTVPIGTISSENRDDCEAA